MVRLHPAAPGPLKRRGTVSLLIPACGSHATSAARCGEEGQPPSAVLRSFLGPFTPLLSDGGQRLHPGTPLCPAYADHFCASALAVGGPGLQPLVVAVFISSS